MPRATVETVEHVARLAHLSLTEDEKQIFTRQLDAILSWAESLQELDTDDVPPMSHAGAAEAWRQDHPGDCLARERSLAQAPDAADGLFRVPKVIG